VSVLNERLMVETAGEPEHACAPQSVRGPCFGIARKADFSS